MKRRIILLLCLLCLCAGGAEKNSHKAACLEMLHASCVPEMLKRAFDAQLENHFKALPELEKLLPPEGKKPKSIVFSLLNWESFF